MTRRALLTCAVLVAACGGAAPLAACGGAAPAHPVTPYPGALRAPADIPGDFVMQQHVRADSASGAHEFDAVLQKQGATLRLLVLGPGGARGFLLEQAGDDVRFTSYIPRELPFPPRYVMLDVHRAFFLGLRAPPHDGTATETRADARVEEDWSGGRLLERRFVRTAPPAGTIRITYEGGWTPGERPPRVVFDNGWLGYRLVIDTVSMQRL